MLDAHSQTNENSRQFTVFIRRLLPLGSYVHQLRRQVTKLQSSEIKHDHYAVLVSKAFWDCNVRSADVKVKHPSLSSRLKYTETVVSLLSTNQCLLAKQYIKHVKTLCQQEMTRGSGMSASHYIGG